VTFSLPDQWCPKIVVMYSYHPLSMYESKINKIRKNNRALPRMAVQPCALQNNPLQCSAVDTNSLQMCDT